MPKPRRYVIEEDGVYYMTTGKLFVYNKNDTKGNDQKKDGVAEMTKKFNDIASDPNKVYQSVRITDAAFSPVNTGEDP